MNDEQYSAAIQQLGQLSAMMEQLPIEEMKHDLARIETVAPILDPTAYRNGMHRISQQGKLVEAASVFVAKIRALKQELTDEGRY